MTVNDKPALVLASNSATFSGLMFRGDDGTLQARTFRKDKFDVKRLDSHRTGVLGLFVATMRWNATYLNLDQVHMDDVTQGDDDQTWCLLKEPVVLGRPLFAARVALRLHDGAFTTFIMMDSAFVASTLVRVALLPRISNPDDVRKVVDMAHSRHWCALGPGNDLRAERFATAAAYVFAEHHGIAVDDPYGKQVIREGLYLQALLRRGDFPWVAGLVHPNEV